MSHLSPCSSCGVDVHAHIVPEHLPHYLKNKVTPANWPSMAPAHECHRHVMIAGSVCRTVSGKCWSVPKRLESYWMEAPDAQLLLRYLNDQIAEMVARSGRRLVGLARCRCRTWTWPSPNCTTWCRHSVLPASRSAATSTAW